MQEDMKAAMKSSDKMRVETLRMVIAELKKEEIDSMKPLDEETFLKVLKRSVKRRKESIDQFKAGNRPDLVEKEEAQLKIVEAYLPQQLSPSEVEKIVAAAIAETGAKTKQDSGKVMKAVMGKYGGQIDGKTVQQIVAAKLQ
jgi:hypothetical protein